MWTPILKIGSLFLEPARAAFQFDVTGEEALRQAKVAPGVVRHLRLTPLTKETQFIDDPLAGQIPFRPREIAPDYVPRWIDTSTSGNMAWLQPPVPEELAARVNARARLYADLQTWATKADVSRDAILNLDTQTATSDPESRRAQFTSLLSKLKVAEVDHVLGQLLLRQEMNERGTGWLEPVADYLGTEKTGVRWNYAVPNVPKILLSSWEALQDQTQCFRLLRQSPLPWQVKPEFEIILGNGTTQYALVFLKEEGVEFRHYRNMTPKKRRMLEDRWRKVLATGYLTAEDTTKITEWQAAIQLEREKASGGGNSKLDPAAQARVLGLQVQIGKLRKSKSGLTDAMRRQADALETKLFYKRVPVSLQEDARSLFNREFDVSIGFSRRGFVWVRIGTGAKPGSEEFRYEIEGITKTGKPHIILPAGSHIMIRSNGGPFGLVYGVADNEELSVLATQPFEIEGEFVEEEWSTVIDAIGLSEDDDPDEDSLYRLHLCQVTARVEEFPEAPAPKMAPRRNKKVRVVLEFTSQKRPEPPPNQFDPFAGIRCFGAQLYRATALRMPSQPEDASEIEWDSRDHGWAVEDLQLQSDIERGARHPIYLQDSERKELNLPVHLDGRYSELGLLKTEEPQKGRYVALVKGGVFKSPRVEDVRYIARAGKLDVKRRIQTSATGNVQSVSSRLDRPIRLALDANGLRPNEYYRLMLELHQVEHSAYAGIPDGALDGLEEFPPSRLGELPDLRPNIGDPLWGWLQQLTQQHCYGWRLRDDGTSAVFEKDGFRDRRETMRWSTLLPFNNPLSVHREEGSGLSIWQDTEDFWSEATLLGAYNPGAGKRYGATHRIWEATAKPESMFFIGEPKRYTIATDDTHKSDASCARALRTFMLLHGLPPWFVRFRTWYTPDAREGDIVTLDGIAIIITTLEFTRFTRGKEQFMHVTGRLYEDIDIA
jgi:hypothetical protein